MINGVKWLVGSVCESGLLRAAAKQVFLRHKNVVYYHVVGDDKPYYSGLYGGNTLARFSKNLEDLKKVFTFETLETVCEYKRGGFTATKPPLAVTFDDGLKLNDPRLLQILDDHGVKVTSFLITSCIDNQNLMWRNKLCAIKTMAPQSICVTQYNALAAKAGLAPIRRVADLMSATSAWRMSLKDELADELWRACDMPPLGEFLEQHQPYFTAEEIEEWLGAGHGIGLHTRTHPFCSRLTSDEVDDEVVQPALDLRKRFGLDFLPFSYPFGDPLPVETEGALLEHRIFDCAFGNRGFAPCDSVGHRLERAGVDSMGLGWPVFGRAMILYGLTGRATNTRQGA
jgi:peptidoglycan/xylan/chitin deacetylase (PgdA/CDA1 family)